MNQPKPGPEPELWIGFYNAVPIALALWGIICLVVWAVVELLRPGIAPP